MRTPALRVLPGAPTPPGWETLWPHDQWHQEQLPHGDLAGRASGQAVLHFEHLRQGWLKAAAKRWARARLLGSTSPRTMACYLRDLRAFSEWLERHAPDVVAPALLTRELVEGYLLWVGRSRWSSMTRHRRVLALRMLLDEQREDALAGLPPGARVLHGEVPRVQPPLPRALPDGSFAQFVAPAKLALLDCEQHRTVILLLAYTGLRVSSVVSLSRDALQRGPDGHPYLRYWNAKLRREAMLPIPAVLEQQLDRQEQYLRNTHPEGTAWLLPSPPPAGRPQGGGQGGRFHLNPRAIGRILKAYVARAQIRTADGRLALAVHPHLFRHHLGTSLVNDNVPLQVIQKLFDHVRLQLHRHRHRGRREDHRAGRALPARHQQVEPHRAPPL